MSDKETVTHRHEISAFVLEILLFKFADVITKLNQRNNSIFPYFHILDKCSYIFASVSKVSDDISPWFLLANMQLHLVFLV